MEATLKNPLFALLIADDPQMRLNILLGRKKISIREGHRDYKPGLGVICDPEDSWVVGVTFTQVIHKILGEVTQEEWEADGFTSQENLLSGMRHYYPNIEFSSPVTVLYWDKVTGEWTKPDSIEAYKQFFEVS